MKNWNMEASKITYDQWLLRLSGIQDDNERAKAASIVWWDFLSNTKEKCPLLTEMLFGWSYSEDISPSRLAGVLMKIGYPEDVAKHRAFSNNRVFQRLGKDEVGQHDPGAESLFFSICEKAIMDVMMLVNRNVIVNGQISSSFQNGDIIVTGYENIYQVQKLIDWVTDGSMERMLEDAGINWDVPVIIEKIGLHPVCVGKSA